MGRSHMSLRDAVESRPVQGRRQASSTIPWLDAFVPACHTGAEGEHVAGEEYMRRTFSRQCPHCTRQVTWPDTPTYPFCSERCQLIDLGAWASGAYRIPCEPLDEEEPWLETDGPEGEGEVEY